ncbi:unnamed protein product [Sphenostylis stenocarpa]|uniref:Uncharacterized protein n=1 Tax=Sphenostylis stenocarpa TaxID=92480 RepID=A0AA86W5G0_9FABA|nr:unnamed protein product [Sphenostylis stenocarpa]
MEGGFVEEGDMKQWKEMHLALPPSFLYGDGKEGASLIFDIGMEIEQLSNLNRPCACSSIQRLLEHHATLHDNSQKASNFNHNFLGKGNFSKFHAWQGTSIENYNAIV